MSTLHEHLTKALAAFGPNGENWTQGHASFRMPNCCTTLAFFRIEPELQGVEIDAGLAALSAELGTTEDGLQKWNDAPERTFGDVKSLYEKAIANAEGR